MISSSNEQSSSITTFPEEISLSQSLEADVRCGASWTSEGYIPTSKEFLKVGTRSVAIPLRLYCWMKQRSGNTVERASRGYDRRLKVEERSLFSLRLRLDGTVIYAGTVLLKCHCWDTVT